MAIGTDAEQINLLMNRLGRRTDTALRATALDEINVAINAAEYGNFQPWFLKTTGTIVTVADTESYALPTGFLREDDDEELSFLDGTDPYFLKKHLKEKLTKSNLGAETDRPTHYAIWGEQIHLSPVPDAVYTITIPYAAATTAITDTATATTNKWLLFARNWILGDAGVQIAGFNLQNQRLAAIFASSAKASRAQVLALHKAREASNADFSDPDKWVP